MDGFLKDFEKMVDDKTLADNIELPASSEFEGKDTFVNMYMSEFDGVSGYTYKKSEGSYNTEEPQYDIYADDKLAERMTLEAKNQHVVLGILTVFYIDSDFTSCRTINLNFRFVNKSCQLIFYRFWHIPDITFISDHVLSGNPYTGVVVDNYIEYNDNCYSCHIAFTKNMTHIAVQLQDRDLHRLNH